MYSYNLYEIMSAWLAHHPEMHLKMYEKAIWFCSKGNYNFLALPTTQLQVAMLIACRMLQAAYQIRKIIKPFINYYPFK